MPLAHSNVCATLYALAAFDLRANGLLLGALRLAAAAAATVEAFPGEFSGASAAGLRAKGFAPLPPPPTTARGAGEGARLMLPAVAAPPAGLAACSSSNAGPGTGVTAPCCKAGGSGERGG